jgi:hypothetical protein
MGEEVIGGKEIGQFKLQLNGCLSPFGKYGQSIYIPIAIEQITILAMKLHRRLNGEDIPITLDWRGLPDD